mmetsp:Transcript_58157/g.101821  ORF Transcript_58157/g.101821 Transcript_58157/m.101821 type:complete len:521 (+) Transcript_58157:90-1652(+)
MTDEITKGDIEDAGPLTPSESCGWYMYDFANSPYYQVYFAALMPILLKWLAEAHAGIYEQHPDMLVPKINLTKTNELAKVTIPELGITAGSYPSLVTAITIFLQTIGLLTFASFGDYGSLRKTLLMILTWVGVFILCLNLICVNGSFWWVAGLLRILVGLPFIMCQTYYNAYLPLLAAAHPDNEGLEGEELATSTEEKDNDMSARGFIAGYAGGLCMLLISYLVLTCFSCDRNTPGDCKNQFEFFFWPQLCVFLVGIWWAGFSLITFRTLQTRPGQPFPEGNVFCLGWKDTCSTLCFITQYRNTWLFLLAFFLWSDASNTVVNVAALILDESGDATIKSIVFSAMLGALACGLGVYIFLKVQQCLKCSAKNLLLFILVVYVLACSSALCGLIPAFGGYGYYLVMAPILLGLGALQSYSRSIFASLIPEGMEAQLFSFFSITDKGGSFVGTTIAFLIRHWTGSYVYTFGYVLLSFLVSGCLLASVDVQQGAYEAKHAVELDEGDNLRRRTVSKRDYSTFIT